VPRTGRRPGEPATRERIEAAARTLFAEEGFRSTSIRAIAARAEVDPALVLHYFGSKRALFLSAIRLPLDLWEAANGGALRGDPDTIGEQIARFGLQIWDDPELRPSLLGIIRSAVNDAQAAALLRELFARQGPAQAIGRLAPSHHELRTQLAISHMIGLAMARHVFAIEPIASADAETLVAIVGPTLQRYVTGDLPVPLDRAEKRRHPEAGTDRSAG
jgi:AcrR family transcriptional regulator